MALITVEVIIPEEAKSVTIQVSDDVPLMDLIEAMETRMELPLRAPDGQWLLYYLSELSQDGQSKLLNDKRTLEENGVSANSVLQLTTKMVECGSDELLLRAFDRLDRRIDEIENRLLEIERAFDGISKALRPWQ